MKLILILPLTTLSVFVAMSLLPLTSSYSTLWITKRCCNMGSFSKTCDDFRPPNQITRQEDIKYCDSIFHDCCLSKKQNTSCSYGIQAAIEGRDCEESSMMTPDIMREDITFTACCNMCRLGLNSPSCFKENVANFSDQAFVDCCSKPRDGRQRLHQHSAHNHPSVTDDSCPSGYHSVNGKCVNINECQTEQHLCRDDEVCFDHEGSYHCESVCNEGYKPWKGRCVVKTFCEKGYTFDLHEDKCINVNECLNNTVCATGFSCRDTQGSFECVQDNCGQGKKMVFDGEDSVSCVDLDECREKQHDCDLYIKHEICRNLNPGFECICALGFMRNDSSNDCFDINECREGTFCDSTTSVCVNTIGSFYCQCKEGFEGHSNSLDSHGKCVPGLLRDSSGNLLRKSSFLTSSSPRKSSFVLFWKLLPLLLLLTFRQTCSSIV